MLPAAALALWNRTPTLTLADVESARLDGRTLVRFWGHGNTLHLFAVSDWPFLDTFLDTVIEQPQSAPEAQIDETGLSADLARLTTSTRRRLEQGERLTYRLISAPKLEAVFPERLRWHPAYAALLELVRQGVVCHGREEGSESGFVHREHWLPNLDWSPPMSEDALPELAVRYLAAYGPAEPSDLAVVRHQSGRRAGVDRGCGRPLLDRRHRRP